ncbi:MAG: hypothetical protein Q8N26_10480 [Myxococcales bacterium]|nr:hypothetical protein [Myxococcales bacterium]
MSVRLVKERAARLVASGQFERAEVLLRQALTQAPRDVQSWLKHAEVLKRLSRDADAVSSYRLAARLLDEAGHHHRAVAALKLGLALVPDDIELITDIIRLEMRARQATAGVRSVFPVSSPSQLLGTVPASSESSLYTSSSSSAFAAEDAAPQLALPMVTSVSSVPRRLDTWAPEPAKAPAPAAGSESPVTAAEASLPDAEALHSEDAVPSPTPAPVEPEGLQLEEAVAAPAPAPVEPEGLQLEVESAPRWPQVVRLSDTRIALRVSEGARWVLFESTGTLSVRFEDNFEVPDDAEWLE